MAEEAGSNQPIIIIKKIRKVQGDGHHGGAWKVAYADFVTAMMAFFLLLWLLNVTTDVQKKGIADYFTPTSASRSESGAGRILGGRTLVTEGSRISEYGVPSVTLAIAPNETATSDDNLGRGPLNEEELRKQIEEREQKAFEQTEAALRQAIETSPELNELRRNILVDMTPEGLRIQIVDQQNQSMFPSGSAGMHERTRLLLQKVSQVVMQLPNKISISGHTDATPFRGDAGYGNWELSADRANASRRVLVEAGLPVPRIQQVVGKADQEPLFANDRMNPSNRRIAIVLLRESQQAVVPARPN
ncbi:MAG: flagellar motor protein MotB [Alphaproteobacteria bacterium]|nr:flagellar motor protein MotB [Alphaproteobacteria bacterium]